MNENSTREAIRSNPQLNAMRAKICRIGALMYDRRLTDAAGGNISARVGDYVCISPRYAGSKYQWNIQPEQVLVVDMDLNILDGTGEISRESKVHFKLYREFGEHGSSVIHAHARNALVFAAAALPIPPVLEATQKFGTVPCVEFAPAHGSDLADHITEAIRGNESRIRKQAMAVLAPWHGLFVMGKDIDATYDAVERVDENAYILLMAKLLENNDLLAGPRQGLVDALKRYEH